MKNIKFISSLIAAFALLFSVSCEDDDLPEAGSIADANPPQAAFFFTDSSQSVLIKNLTNSSRRGSTSVFWTLPEGAEFTFNTLGVLTTETDDEIVVRFPATIDDPNDGLAGYPVGIEVTDDNGVSSGVQFFNVQVNFEEGKELATAIASVNDGFGNFERILDSSNSGNANGGVLWSVFQDGVELDINELLTTPELDFLNQTSRSEEVLITFPNAGDYEVVLTAINFNGIEDSVTQPVTIDQLTTPIPEFSYSSNEDYSIQTLVNTTPDSETVFWTLPDGASFVNGTSETDETIQVTFPSSGNFDVSLAITSNGFNEDGDPVVLESDDTDGSEIITIPIVNSLASIPEPTLLAGGFERPIDAYLSPEGLARTNNDLGKEYWIPDGVSQRVFTPGTSELFPAYPGETDANLQTWFTPEVAPEFNRPGTTSNARTGDAAASWDDRAQLRAAVQRIEVVPGVDYKVTFWYENVNDVTDVSLLALILDERVVRQNQIGRNNGIDDLANSIIAQDVFNEIALGYIEASITFNSGNQEAIKLYFNTSESKGAYRLDDVTISID